MADGIFNHIKIGGIACAVPTNHVKAEQYIKYFGKEAVQKFVDTTGIEARYLSNGKQTASDLCYTAAKQLLERQNITPEEIGMLIFITQNPDYKQPSTAFVLHKRLGLKEDCIAFDVNLGCSAFVYGLHLLAGMIQGGALRKGLLLVGDAWREHGVSDDHSNSMMFGEAGTACLVEAGEGEVKTLLKADGGGYQVMINPGGAARFPFSPENIDWTKYQPTMDGEETFAFSITKVPRLFKEFFQKYGCSMEDFDYCILHQANLFMLKHIAKKLKLPKEKMPVSLDRFGNTNGSTIPVTIASLCEESSVPDRLRLITAGFGIGLSWGIVSFDIYKRDVLPILYTDDYFEEGYHVS